MRIRFLVLFLVLVALLPLAVSQCKAPVLDSTPRGNLLTPALEFELGEIDAEQEAVSIHLLEVDSLKKHLEEIGKRIQQKLPPNEIKFRYYIVDEASANAWALPGGRIYVTRKLISFAKSEDELATVLAHEMGHQVVHHGAVTWSRIIRDTLGVTSIKDRNELEDVLNRYMDVYRRKNVGSREDDGDKEQLQADQVGVYAMAAAGYDPKAAVQFWDRFADLKGKKGNVFLDFVGVTHSDSKRLRSFASTADNLPANCLDKRTPVDTAAFQKWQNTVRTYSGPSQRESLHQVAFKKKLNPPLRSEISHLRFSSDGKYILAQDESSIFVLTTNPLATMFRIDAENAHPASFAADNKHLTFYTDALRVERWNVETKELEDVGEVHAVRGCLQSELSADGKYLACLEPGPDFLPFQLAVFDTTTSEAIFRKSNFVGSANGDDQYWEYLYLIRNLDSESLGITINMEFSPDSKYLVTGRANNPLTLDLSTKKEISLPGSMRKYLMQSFAFLGPDRLVAVDGDRGEKSVVLRFPSGDVVEDNIQIGPVSLYSPGHGDYVIVRPMPKSPVGIMDLQKKQYTIANRTNAIDIYDGLFVSERVSGELALYKLPNPSPLATVQLPAAPIGTVHAFSLSPDQKYLAMSERKRGSIWDVETGQRVLFVRGFRGVAFTGNSMWMDFPAQDDYVPPLLLRRQSAREAEKIRNERPGHTIVRMSIDGAPPQERDKFLRKTRVRMNGDYFLVLNADDPDKTWDKNVTLEVRDSITGVKLWSKRFNKKVPSLNYRSDSDDLVLVWELSESAVKQEVQNDDEAKRRLDNLHEQFEGSYFIEVLDLRTGNALAKFPIDAGNGSFKLNSAYVFANKVFLNDSFDRISIYNFKGERLVRFYGTLEAVSKDGNYLLVEAARGDLKLYSTSSRKLVDELKFESRISQAAFASDGRKLFVLTTSQDLYGIDLSSGPVSAK